MGRRGYPPEFRRKVLDLIAAGRPVVDVVRDLGISAQSIYTWLAGCRDYWSKYELGWHISPTANQHDAIAAVELTLTMVMCM